MSSHMNPNDRPAELPDVINALKMIAVDRQIEVRVLNATIDFLTKFHHDLIDSNEVNEVQNPVQ